MYTGIYTFLTRVPQPLSKINLFIMVSKQFKLLDSMFSLSSLGMQLRFVIDVFTLKLMLHLSDMEMSGRGSLHWTFLVYGCSDEYCYCMWIVDAVMCGYDTCG